MNNRLYFFSGLWIIILATSSILLFPASAVAATHEKHQPNIVFILSDNQRWDFMGCAGHPFVKTPSMDRLAGEGILFKNAFVTTAICSPSRASFLTGQYAHTHGVKKNITVWNNDNETFLELLKKAGYDTSFIGKWHMPGKLPRLRGVDQFVTFTIEKGQGRYVNCPLIVDGVETPSRKAYITEELTDYAIRFMAQPRKNPFCIYLSHKAVHHRWIPPPDMADLYREETPPFPREYNPFNFSTNGYMFEGMGFTQGFPARLYRNYSRTVTALDREIGRLLEKIDELGITDNTIVIFAGDNGFFWGEHQLAGTGRWAYEESIRIPFIVRAPGFMDRKGRKANQMVLNIDLAPTLLEMAGAPVPAAMEGESFLPALRSSGARGRKAWLYEYFKDFPYQPPTMHAVRTDTHIYIEYQESKKPELYNIINDPRQLDNIIAKPEKKLLVDEMKRMLRELKKGNQG